MDALCGTVFWDYNQTWNTTTPDFSECFQKTVLIWVPAILLCIFTPLEIFNILQQKYRYIPWTALGISRLVTSLLLISVTGSTLFVYSQPNDPLNHGVTIGASVVDLFCYTLVLILELLDRKSGLHSSAALFSYWIAKTVSAGLIYYSWMMTATSEESTDEIAIFLTTVVTFPLVVSKLIFSAVADDVIRPKGSKRKPCPVEYSSPLTNVLFGWMTPLAWKGFKRGINEEDIWELDRIFRSDECYAEFEKLTFQASENNERRQQRTENRQSVMKIIWQANRSKFIVAILIKYVGDCFSFINPLMLEKLIAFVSSDQPAWHGYLYAIIIFISSASYMLCLHNSFYRLHVVGIRARSVVVSAIYRKALRMTNNAKKTTTVGEIVTLMSVDSQKLTEVCMYMGLLLSTPIQIGVALYLLWGLLGPSVIVGLIIILVLIPLNTIIANITSKIQAKVMKQKDKRTKLMNELLNGIKVLKLYAWEYPFAAAVRQSRVSELLSLKRILYLQAFIQMMLQMAPILIAFITFGTYVLLDDSNVLDATKVFVSLSVFDIIRFPLYFFPVILALVVQAHVSIKRIDKFMGNEELKSEFVSRDLMEDDPLVIEESSFAWSKDDLPVLQDINLRVKDGSLVAVVGSVGSGKSSLVAAILGELEKIGGRVNVKGKVAYVAQQAWIQNTTLRNNILFGRAFNQYSYDQVIDACALRPDLPVLPGGDLTEIGEKGINLSGGQKQRVSIARAVYSDSDIYLLDDPLSAVDAHVGKHIFEKVIGPSGILKSKTRLLVTHGISHLPYVDSIVVLKQGSIAEIGSYEELLEKGGYFAEFFMAYLKEQEEDLDEAALLEMQESVLPEIKNELIKRQISERITRALSIEEGAISSDQPPRRASSKYGSRISLKRSLSRVSQGEQIPPPALPSDLAKLIKDEQMETGKVAWSVYKDYFNAFGATTFATTVAILAISWSAAFSANFWLSLWSNDKPKADGSQDFALRDLRLGVYGALGGGQVAFALLSAIFLVWGTIRASSTLHDNMLTNVLRSPMSFFDTTPLGRIVNRFSRDVDVTDVLIPSFIRPVLSCFMQLIGIIVVIGFGFPLFLVLFLPVGIIYYVVQRLYIDASRQLKRMESVSRSPIYVHFSETISGLQTLRAFGVQDRFIQGLEEKVDHNSALYFPMLGANRWLGIRLEGVGDIIVFAAALLAVTSRGTLEPGVVGLSLNYAMSVTFVLMFMVRSYTDLESNIVSVERMKEYSELPEEAPDVVEEYRPLPTWPEKGVVKFQNYSTKYRDGLDLVLKEISCDIQSTEKVGIVGRTGAGKSSLTLALFRLIEGTNGAIFIDGIDISKIGLHDLRSCLTIIPQDPVLFFGTLRQNLDPFSKYTDELLWRALEHSHLKEFIATLPAQLDHEINEGGENLSVGQRQLVCLARALLRKTKVLILDEATAAIDLETDDVIQATIRKEFADCTVLTIAHRLNTIMDSDRVIVLDQGIIKEFDSPSNLLQDPNSIFYSMASDAGLV